MGAGPKTSPKFRRWIEARKRSKLSHAHVQMARELGMNPQKLGGIANHRQEPWKMPLPQFIEHLYERQFGRNRPERVVSIEGRARELAEKKVRKRAARLQRSEGSGGEGTACKQEGAPG